MNKKAQASTSLDNLPQIVITIGVLCVLLGVMATTITSVQTEMVMDSDYVSHTDTNVTFTAGSATLSSPYCTSIDSVVVP